MTKREVAIWDQADAMIRRAREKYEAKVITYEKYMEEFQYAHRWGNARVLGL